MSFHLMPRVSTISNLQISAALVILYQGMIVFLLEYDMINKASVPEFPKVVEISDIDGASNFAPKIITQKILLDSYSKQQLHLVDLFGMSIPMFYCSSYFPVFFHFPDFSDFFKFSDLSNYNNIFSWFPLL